MVSTQIANLNVIRVGFSFRCPCLLAQNRQAPETVGPPVADPLQSRGQGQACPHPRLRRRDLPQSLSLGTCFSPSPGLLARPQTPFTPGHLDKHRNCFFSLFGKVRSPTFFVPFREDDTTGSWGEGGLWNLMASRPCPALQGCTFPHLTFAGYGKYILHCPTLEGGVYRWEHECPT